MNNSKLINPAPIIKKLADRCLVAKGLECSVLGELIDLLRAAPAVDAVEVVHGRWIFKHNPIEDPKGYFIRIVCSECNLHTGQKSNYCPNCGAKMDGDGE